MSYERITTTIFRFTCYYEEWDLHVYDGLLYIGHTKYDGDESGGWGLGLEPHKGGWRIKDDDEAEALAHNTSGGTPQKLVAYIAEHGVPSAPLRAQDIAAYLLHRAAQYDPGDETGTALVGLARDIADGTVQRSKDAGELSADLYALVANLRMP